jgi:hypothetical protein
MKTNSNYLSVHSELSPAFSSTTLAFEAAR